MARLLILFLVGAVAAGVAIYAHAGPGSGARHICNTVEQLCGDPAGDACREDIGDVPPADLVQIRACSDPADSCLELAGCLAGSAVRQLGTGVVRGLTP